MHNLTRDRNYGLFARDYGLREMADSKMADKEPSQVDYSQIQKGMALRVKYRLHPSNPKRKMMLSNLGIHMMNRGLHDIYPNGDDVRALGLRLIPGFDYAEANHNGVAVEEIPASVQSKGIIIFRDPVTKEAYESIGEYNYKHCSGSEYLGTCFDKIEARLVLAGTLSHSHLLLVLLSVRSKAKWKTYDEAKEDGTFKFPCDGLGCLDLSAITDKDAVLEQLLREGLDMELLSHKIYIEEPYGCITISNALNNANKVALKTTVLAALSTLNGYVGLSAITDKLSFEAVREGLRSQLAELVDEPDFINMFNFVCQLGASENSYVPGFLDFTTRFVSSQQRRLRLCTFSVLSETSAGPLGKVALLKRSLRSNPDSAKYCPSPETELTKVCEAEFKLLEECLFFFHTTCRDAVKSAITDPIPFFANVDGLAASAFVAEIKNLNKEVKSQAIGSRRGVYKVKEALTLATAKYWSEIYNKRKADVVVPESIKIGWPEFRAQLEKQKQSAMTDATQVLQPVLIRWDETRGTSSVQPELRKIEAAPMERVALPHAQWLETPAVLQLGKEAAAESAAMLVLHNLHHAACKAGPVDGIAVWYDPKLKSTVVTTTKPFEPHRLSLAPCVPVKPKLIANSTHPLRVCLEILDLSEKTRVKVLTTYIHPEWDVPGEKAVDVNDGTTSAMTDQTGTASAMTDKPGTEEKDVKHLTWQWSAKNSMHPIWAVRRPSDEELKEKHMETNVELVYKDITITTVNGSATQTWVVRVPFLENRAKLAQGVELIWSCFPKKRKESDKTHVGWIDEYKASQAKAKAESKRAKKEESKGNNAAALKQEV